MVPLQLLEGKKLVETSECACILNNLFHFQLNIQKKQYELIYRWFPNNIIKDVLKNIKHGIVEI